MLTRESRLSNLSITVFTYTVLISAWFVAWLLVGDGNWWLTLLNRVAPYLFIPMPLLLLWGVFSRRFKPLIALIFPCLFFVWIYQSHIFSKSSSLSESKSMLRVMTYNVLFSNLNYDGVADVVLTHNPDLVALQEVKSEMMNALRKRLTSTYPYSFMGTENAYGTTAIFSKYPFYNSHVLDLQADRPAVIVKTRVDQQNVTFAAVHLLAYNLWWTEFRDIPSVVLQRTADQNQQVKVLLTELVHDKGLVIVACDCNSYETSSSYRILDQSLSDAAREVGWLIEKDGIHNLKRDITFQHIDFVWFRGLLKPLNVYRIENSGGSDHLPLIAVFDIQ